MPRLTRTQKFAELRDSLANDKESSLQTKDLNDYQDRLDSITEILSSQNIKEETPVYEVPAYETPVYEAPVNEAPAEVKPEPKAEDPKYTWKEFEETPIEQLVESFKNSELEKQIQEISNETKSWESAHQVQEEVKQEAPVAEKVEEVSMASSAQVKPLIETPVYEAPVIDTPIISRPEENIKPLIDETPYMANYRDVEYSIKNEPVYKAPLINDEIPHYEAPVVKEEVKEEEKIEYPGYYRPSPEIEALYKEAEEKAELEAAKEEPVVEEVKPLIEDAVVETPVYEEPVTETPVVEEPAYVEPAVEEPVVQEPVYEAPVVEEPVVEEPVVEEPVVETPAVEEAQLEEEPVLEETAEPLAETKFPKTPVEEFVDNHAADHETEVNSYLSDTMDEVSKYNMANGDMTISQLTNNMVNEIRHPGAEEVKAEAPVVEEEKEDEEFSNTVSMEISKIMDEIDAFEAKEEPKVEEEPITAELVEEVEEVRQPVKEEHPVLAKALEEPEEEVVEIKNLKELEAEPTRDTLSNTIPFVVATDDDEEEIEDDDEDGSNTILNIILIVLIIVLVAVLGLIVFYILKTKGVI